MIFAERPLLAMATALVLTTSLRVPGLNAAPVAKPLAQAYQNILTVMRRPSTNGLLITSVELPAALARAGLRPADIITHIADQRVTSAATLHAISKANSDSKQPIAIIAVRGLLVRQFLQPAAILRPLTTIGLISVRAGAPAPLNPPPTVRHKLRLRWSRVQTLEPRGHEAIGHDTWMLVFYHQLVVGAIHLQVSHRGSAWKLLWNQESVSHGPLPALAWQISFDPGDYQHQPAMRMRTFIRWTTAGKIHARCRGDTFYVSSATSHQQVVALRACPTAADAAPMPLMALLAEALPAQRSLVLPVSSLAQNTLETRLGCVLTTSPQQEISFGGADQQVRIVRMLWMDIPRYKFWLSPAGELLGIHFGHGFSAYRVSGAAIVRHVIPASRLICVLPPTITIRQTAGE